MNKFFLIGLFIAASFSVKAQMPLTTSNDSLANTVTKDSMITAAGWGIVSVNIVYGPGSYANGSITGLQPGKVTFLELLLFNGSSYAVVSKAIIVAPLPPVALTITSSSFVGGNIVVVLSNGQTLTL